MIYREDQIDSQNQGGHQMKAIIEAIKLLSSCSFKELMEILDWIILARLRAVCMAVISSFIVASIIGGLIVSVLAPMGLVGNTVWGFISIVSIVLFICLKNQYDDYQFKQWCESVRVSKKLEERIIHI
jgi:hypothetical protein